jgi:hypothetical protein
LSCQFYNWWLRLQGDSPISGLMLFTLSATVFVIAGAFIYLHKTIMDVRSTASTKAYCPA